MYERIQKRTSELLSKGSVSDKPSQYVDMILFILIILNITAVCLESVKFIGDKYKVAFNIFELISVIIFSIEYLLRVWSSPSRHDLGNSSSLIKRLKYIFSFTGLIDFLVLNFFTLFFWRYRFKMVKGFKTIKIIKNIKL